MNSPNENNNHDVHVPQLTMKTVWDIRNGQEIDAQKFFNTQPESEIINMRRLLQLAVNTGQPYYVCPHCHQMVKISGRKNERGIVRFFSHLYDSDDCPIKTTTGLTLEQILASKYGLVAESERHKSLKTLIALSLNSNGSIQKGVSDVQIERRIDSDLPYMRWRKPDVQANYKGKKLVFELQLSTTFISTIVDRDLFYRLNDYYIVWVFNFEDNEEYVNLSNLMCKDIYYANKRNVFIFDKEAQEESERRGELILKCNWLNPNGKWNFNNDNVNKAGVLVSLDQLSFDEANKKLFYHDADADFFKEYPKYLEIRKQLEFSREEIVEALMRKEKEEIDEFYGQSQERRDHAIQQMIRTGGQVEVFKKKGKYGLSFEDTIIVPAKYTFISEYDDRGYVTLKYNRLIGLADRIGNIIVPCEASDIYYLNNYIIYRKSTIKWYLSGINEAIAPYFKDNLSLSRLDEHVEVINISNPSPKHPDHSVYILEGKLVLFRNFTDEEGKWGARFLYGDIAHPFVYDDVTYQNGIFVIEGGSKYGIMDYWMNEIIPLAYSSVSIEQKGKKYILEKDGKWSLADENGTIILGDQGDNIVKKTDRYIHLIDKSGLVHLSDYSGHLFKWEGCYNKIEETDDPELFIVTSNYNEGVVDINGKIIIPCKFEKISLWGNRVFRIEKTKLITHKIITKWGGGGTYQKRERRYCLINDACNKTTSDDFLSIGFPEDGKMKAVIEDGRKGLLDENGIMIADKTETFASGYIKQHIFERWGLTNPNGDYVLPCQFLEIDRFGEKLLRVKTVESNYQIYDLSGSQVSKVYNVIKDLEDGYAIADDTYLDCNGQECFRPVETLPNGNVIIHNHHHFGLYGSDGTILSKPIYSLIKSWNNRFLVYSYYDYTCKNHQRVSIHDLNGQEIGIQQYDKIEIKPDKCKVWIGDSYSYLDENGQDIIDEHSKLPDGRIIVKHFGFLGITDSSGRILFPFKYTDIQYLKTNTYLVKEGDSYTIIGDCCKVNENYSKLDYVEETNHLIAGKSGTCHFSGGFYYSCSFQYYGLITIDGNELLPFAYKSIYYDKKSNLYVAKTLKDKYVLIKKNGCDVIPNEYDKISIHDDGGISVCIGDKEECIDFKGKMVLRPIKELDKDHFVYQWFNGYGIARTGGEKMTPPIYSSIDKWNDDIFLCKKLYRCQDSFALIKIDGTVIVSAPSITPLIDGIATVIHKLGNTYHIDSQGLPIMGKKQIMEKYYLTSYEGFYGIRDATSNVILNEEYLSVTPLHHGLFEIRNEEGRGVSNSQGKILIPCKYDCIFAYFGYLICIKDKDIIKSDVPYNNQTPITLSVKNMSRFDDGLILQIGGITAFISEYDLSKAKLTTSQFSHGGQIKVIISKINWGSKRLYARIPSVNDFSYIEGQIIEVEVTSKMVFAVLAKDERGNNIFIHKSMMTTNQFKRIKEKDKLKIIKNGYDKQHKKDVWKVIDG